MNEKAGKYLPLLSMLYAMLLILSVFLDYKFVNVGVLIASSATFVISSTFLLNDIITEVYGYDKARFTVWSSLLCLIIFALVGFLISRTSSPDKYSSYANAYSVVLVLMLRAAFANALAIALGSFLNMYIISKWKIYAKGKYFWFRCLCTSFMGEIIYSLCVVSFVNVGMVSLSELVQILLVSISFKFIFNAFAVVPTSFICFLLKRSEKIDVFDYHLDFNPFKLGSKAAVAATDVDK